MPVGELVVLGLLGFGMLVYLAVIGMCRAASRADRADRGGRSAVAPPPDVLVDLDGTVLRGFTPPLGVRRVRGGPASRQALVLDRVLDLDAVEAADRRGRESDR